MKNTLYISFLLMIFSLSSCSKKMYTSMENVNEMLAADQFTFLAERANPTNFDVINVMNSIPNRGGSQQFLNLDYGYVVTLKNKELIVDLPYFGRLYTPNMDPSKNSFNFTSKDFILTKSQNKKSAWAYKILTKDQHNNITLNIEIYPNGKSYTYVNSSDRTAISYDGYVMKNKPDIK
ncbi:MAG: DUF4251 domain-containing protein [Chryseobacterium sp.]|nr:DUF4251 domain-containing protein [Chryseobacterium sp.]